MKYMLLVFAVLFSCSIYGQDYCNDISVLCLKNLVDYRSPNAGVLEIDKVIPFKPTSQKPFYRLSIYCLKGDAKKKKATIVIKSEDGHIIKKVATVRANSDSTGGIIARWDVDKQNEHTILNRKIVQVQVDGTVMDINNDDAEKLMNLARCLETIK